MEILQPRLAPDGYEFVNAGIDGDLAWNVLQRIGDVIRCEPDIVTLLVGSNDVIATSRAFLEKIYRRLQRLPHAPTLDWYTRCVEEILTRCSRTSARIAVLDIPLIGEDLNSDMNHRVDSYNQALRRVAAAHAVECPPLHDRLTRGRREPRQPALPSEAHCPCPVPICASLWVQISSARPSRLVAAGVCAARRTRTRCTCRGCALPRICFTGGLPPGGAAAPPGAGCRLRGSKRGRSGRWSRRFQDAAAPDLQASAN